MNTNFQKVREIFMATIDRPANAWGTYLDEACAGDTDLRRQVALLLDAHAGGEGPLDQGSATGPPTNINESLGESAGAVIGPYKLLQVIGEGGMGVVFMAEQAQPVRRKVALKILKPGMDTRQVIARFEAERQALAIMDHPNIAKVFDGGATPSGRPYFVMELVKGVSITEFCDQGHLSPRQRLELFLPVCHAVQHAHQKGIIHRDLKPSNVLVTRHDTMPVPKIIDFGVAKALGQALTDKTLFTGIAQMVGTPLYMSPEQAGMSDLDVDTRTDIYSLGVLLYELLTGTTPFTKERFKTAAYDEIRRIIREEEPPKPSTRLSDLSRSRLPGGTSSGTSGSPARQAGPTSSLASVSALRQTEPANLTKLVKGELDWIVMKCLEKDRNRRYETASAFAADVQRYLDGATVHAVPPSAGYRLRKFMRRNKRALVSTALLGLMLLVLVGSLGWVMSDRAARQSRTAFEVHQFLQQAKSMYANNKLPEAVAEVQKARGVLEAGRGDKELGRQVQLWLTDLDMAAKLEEIRMRPTHPATRDRVYAEYAQVFRDYGIDLEALSTEEAAARIADSRIKLDLVLALDRWAAILRSDPRMLDPASWQRNLAISRAADPDPWRLRYNAAYVAKDLQVLREIANTADPSRLRTRTLADLGDSLRQTGDVKTSVAFLRKVQRQYPDDFSINSSLAWSLRSLDPPLWDEAIAFRRVAVALRPHSYAARLNLGASLHAQGKLDEAIAWYEKARDLEPKSGTAYYDLAVALRGQGRLAESIANFEKASDLLPNDPNPLNGLAWELATCTDSKLRDPARAVALAKKVIELSIKQRDDRDRAGQDRLGNYWNTLAVANYRAGHPEDALAALYTSLEFSNDGNSRFICEDCFFLAMANRKLDKKGEARKWYDRAVEWMNENQPRDGGLIQLRTEASELLEIANKNGVENPSSPRAKQ